jgi:hypothetical protein
LPVKLNVWLLLHRLLPLLLGQDVETTSSFHEKLSQASPKVFMLKAARLPQTIPPYDLFMLKFSIAAQQIITNFVA